MPRTGTIAQAVAALRKSLTGPVLTAGDEGYEEARRVWNGTIDRRPAIVARCRRAADVALAVGVARDHELLVAVRGGGHSFPGFSTCDDGLVIDLAGMRDVSVDVHARTARAQGGALWADLDAAAQARGLAVTGGAVSHTGVGGLTLGGGMGWLMRKHGLSCDNLLSAEVVLADGGQVTASERSRPDLFWALRGGGGNFGVATRLEFRLHEVPPPTVAMVFFAPERGREVLRAFGEWAPACPDETQAILFFLNAPPLPFLPAAMHFAPFFVLMAATLADQPAAEATLRPMRELGHAFEMITPMPYTVLQSSFDEAFGHGLLVYEKGQFLAALGEDTIDGILEGAARKRAGLSQIHLWSSGGGAVARVAPGDTAFVNRTSPFLVDVIGAWEEPGQADSERAWVRQTWEACRGDWAGTYVNFLAEADPARVVDEVYGRRTYDRLAAIKAIYDPGNLFRLNQNVAPAAVPV
jgi:FAD/FMN-containing dehydrogenase